MRASLDRATLVVIALALLAAGAVGTLRWTRYASAGPTDLAMICTSQQMLAASGNPYDPRVLEAAGFPTYQPLTLPPLLVRAYAPVCGVPPYWLAAFAGAALVILTWRGLRVPFVLSLGAVFAGFGAFPWVALGANHAMLEALAVGAAAVALAADAPLTFGAAIGVAAFLKSLVPLPMLLSAVRWPRGAAIRAVACGLLAAGAFQLLQWVLDPAVAGHYWHAILTVYPGHAARDLQIASEDNPSPFAFLPIVARHVGLDPAAGVFAAVLVSASFMGAWVLSWRRVSSDPGARVWAAMLLIAVIVVAHPRMKQYSPFALTPLLAFGLARMPHAWRAWMVALTCVVPHASVLLLVLPPLPTSVIFLLQYSQWLVLALSVALALWPAGVRAVARGGTGARVTAAEAAG